MLPLRCHECIDDFVRRRWLCNIVYCSKPRGGYRRWDVTIARQNDCPRTSVTLFQRFDNVQATAIL